MEKKEDEPITKSGKLIPDKITIPKEKLTGLTKENRIDAKLTYVYKEEGKTKDSDTIDIYIVASEDCYNYEKEEDEENEEENKKPIIGAE